MYEFFHRSQGFEQSIEKLRKSYFRDTNNADEIERGNIDDIMYGHNDHKLRSNWASFMRMEYSYKYMIKSDSSIENDTCTPFESCESEDNVFCQEISNDPKSSVTTKHQRAIPL